MKQAGEEGSSLMKTQLRNFVFYSNTKIIYIYIRHHSKLVHLCSFLAMRNVTLKRRV